MKTITVTVTRKHFAAANKALANRRKTIKKNKITALAPRSSVCLVAQALTNVFPGEEIHVSWSSVRVGPWTGENRKYAFSKTAQELIYRFDGMSGPKLKASEFPVTFRMKAMEMAKVAA